MSKLLRQCLEKYDELEKDIHAWAYFDKQAAYDQYNIMGKGPLKDTPVGVKDIFNTADMPTQMGSPIWKDFTPGNDARVVYNLRMAGAIIPGKTVTAEFAVHTPGPTRNPRNPERSPGTSSSGSAAAIAAGMVPMALGSQTAGSTIRPASYCGVLGFKPTFGLIPRTGMLKTTDTLDTVGMFADTVDNLRLLFDVIRVHGLDYPYSELHDTTKWHKPRIIRGPKWDEAEQYVRDAVTSLPYDCVSGTWFLSKIHYLHSIIYDKTLAYYFQEEYKQKTLVSELMYNIIERGQRITLEQYKEAIYQQAHLAKVFDRWMGMNNIDILLDFSTAATAPMFGEDDRPDHCLIWTFLGLPVINVPLFTGPDGMPFGLQVIGRKYGDYKILNFAKELMRDA